MSPSEPSIIPRSEHAISRKWISPNALRVLYRLKEQGHYAYLVGGGVRDLLLGREPKDFDIATDAKPNEIKKIFRNCRLIGRRFRLAHIHFPNEIIEVATFRSNITEEPAAEVEPAAEPVAAEQPETAPFIEAAALAETLAEPQAGAEPGAPPVIEAKPRPPRMLKTEDGMILRDNVFGTPEQDALRRDFTVNAMFYNIADFSVIDYVDGMNDLRKGLIRLIGDPETRFIEDPVRMVRAVRFAAMLGFEIEEHTLAALMALKDRVALASPARMYEEVQKLFLLGEGEKVYQLLRKTGLFGVIFPKLNEWVDTEAGGFPHTWIGKSLEWVDTCVQTGRKVDPAILFGLLFGQYIDEQAATRKAGGMNHLDALTSAIVDTLAEQAQRVQIPRKVGLPMRDMYWNQHRFERREGKHPRFFLHRPGFSDAWEYFRFRSNVSGENADLRAWWKEFIKANPVPPPTEAAAPEERKPARKLGERPSHNKRRRRRGGKGRRGPGAPEKHTPSP